LRGLRAALPSVNPKAICCHRVPCVTDPHNIQGRSVTQPQHRGAGWAVASQPEAGSLHRGRPPRPASAPPDCTAAAAAGLGVLLLRRLGLLGALGAGAHHALVHALDAQLGVRLRPWASRRPGRQGSDVLEPAPRLGWAFRPATFAGRRARPRWAVRPRRSAGRCCPNGRPEPPPPRLPGHGARLPAPGGTNALGSKHIPIFKIPLALEVRGELQPPSDGAASLAMGMTAPLTWRRAAAASSLLVLRRQGQGVGKRAAAGES
jgi:hypothetical protein